MTDIRALLLFLLVCSPLLMLLKGCASELPPPAGVPEGERTGIVGTIKDNRGNPISGAVVTVANIENQRATTTTANSDGAFDLPGITPGSYRVTATFPGLATQSTEILVRGGQAAFVSLVLAAGEVEVLEKSFNDEIDFQAWLKAQSENGKRLRGIIPVSDKESLFLFVPFEAKAATPYLVQRVDGQLGSTKLMSYIKLHSDKTFVGVHRLGNNSYVMVFDYGKQ
jgi:hypothetical protein